MKLRSLILMAVAITPPAYADEAMTVAQEIVSNWQTAYNSGNAGKIADLYVQDAVFSSGVLGVLKGKSEIEKALADQMKKTAFRRSGSAIRGGRYGEPATRPFSMPKSPFLSNTLWKVT